MGDRSAISIIKDTLGKPSRAYDDARNVKNYKGRVVFSFWGHKYHCIFEVCL